MKRSATRDPIVGLANGQRALVTNSATVAGWTLLSRVTGFGRIAAIAAVLGPTYFGNLFQASNQIPILAFELIAGQLIASLLVPAMVRHLDGRDRLASQRVARGFLGAVLVAFTALAAMVALCAPLVLGLMGLGVSDSTALAARISLGWPLLAVVMLQLPLYGLIGTANAVQNARGRYALAAAAPALENVGVIATLLAYAALRGTGTEIADATGRDVVFLAIGSTVSVVAHAAVQWWGARQAGVTLVPRRGWKDPEVHLILRLAVPSLRLAALTGYNNVAFIVAAGAVAGGVVASQLALGFLLAVVAISARPVAVASLPTLARLHRDRDDAEFRSEYLRSLQLALLVLAPATAALLWLGRPLAGAVAFGEMGGAHGVELLGAIIPALAIGVLGEGMTAIATQASYARLDMRPPLRAATLRAGLLTIGIVLAFTLTDGAALLAALGASVSVANTASFLWLHRAAMRTSTARIGPEAVQHRSRSTARPAMAAMSLAAIAGGAGWVTNRLVESTVGARPSVFIALSVVGLVYLGLQLSMGAPEVTSLTRLRVGEARLQGMPVGAQGFWPLDAHLSGPEPTEKAGPIEKTESAGSAVSRRARGAQSERRIATIVRSLRNTGPFEEGAASGDLDIVALLRGAGTVVGGIMLAQLNPAVTLVVLTITVTAWLLLRSGSNSHLGALQPIDALVPTTATLAALAGIFPLVTGVAALLIYAVFRGAGLGLRERNIGIGTVMVISTLAALVAALDRSPTPLAATVPIAIAAYLAVMTRSIRHVVQTQTG